MGIAGRACFFFLVIARDPQILSGVQDGQQATAVTRLRNFAAADEFDHRGQEEPQKLRDGQREDRKNDAEIASASQRRECPTAGTDKEQRQNCTRGESELSRKSQGKYQR